jgi:hypothetical protein
LTPAKVLTRRNRVLVVEGKNLLEFKNEFHNFRISIKNPLNFYRFNLVPVRLKLTGKFGAR